MEIYEEIRADREMGARRLVAEYRPRLETAARLLCADPHKAEDLVFRAFERAIFRIDEFRPTGSFYYWIYTILLNLHRMDVRKPTARNEVVVAQEDMPEVEDESARNPFEAFAFRGSAEAVLTFCKKSLLSPLSCQAPSSAHLRQRLPYHHYIPYNIPRNIHV